MTKSYSTVAVSRWGSQHFQPRGNSHACLRGIANIWPGMSFLGGNLSTHISIIHNLLILAIERLDKFPWFWHLLITTRSPIAYQSSEFAIKIACRFLCMWNCLEGIIIKRDSEIGCITTEIRISIAIVCSSADDVECYDRKFIENEAFLLRNNEPASQWYSYLHMVLSSISGGWKGMTPTKEKYSILLTRKIWCGIIVKDR